MTVRRGRPGDRARLRAIQDAALPEPAPELLNAALEGPPELFVAVDDGEPVGYGLVVAPGGTAYMPELAVAPDRQGEGFGEALLEAVCAALMEDHERLRVTARADDERARSFYEQHGFEPGERFPDHFESGDGITLVRDL